MDGDEDYNNYGVKTNGRTNSSVNSDIDMSFMMLDYIKDAMKVNIYNHNE